MKGKCPECGKECVNLQTHTYMAHKGGAEKVGAAARARKDQVSCPVCGKRFHRMGLPSHIASHSRPSEEAGKRGTRAFGVGTGDRIPCPVCRKVIGRQGFTSHLGMHISQKPEMVLPGNSHPPVLILSCSHCAKRIVEGFLG